MPSCDSSPFFQEYHYLKDQLTSEITVLQTHGRKGSKVTAIWDTGAQMSVISKKIADELKLCSHSRSDIFTPIGKRECDLYLIDIVLPTNIIFNNVLVFGVDPHYALFDFYLGMDILNKGDFSLSNYNGCTSFSFRSPSKGVTDFRAPASKKRR